LKKIINWYKLLKKQSIGHRFAVYILLFSSIVTLILTALQLGIEYHKDVSEIDSRMSQIRDGYSQSLSNSLWVTSKKDVKLQLEGIIKLPDIEYIEVLSEKNEVVVAMGLHKPKQTISQVYPLTYMYRGQKLTLGKLHIVATLDGVHTRLRAKVLVILLTQGVKTFLVSFFILYLFHILIGRHLSTIARFVVISKGTGQNDELKLDRPRSKYTQDDELNQTIDAINEMKKNLKSYYYELEESEQNLSITLHSIGDGVIATDTSGLITRMNMAAERLTGWSFSDALGRSLDDVFRIIKTETRLPADNPVEMVMTHAQVLSLANHITLLARDAKEYQIANSAAPIRNAQEQIVGVVLVFSDVSEKYKNQAEISRLSQVVNQYPFSTIITDRNGVIEFVNRHTLTLTGYYNQEIIGKKMNLFSSGVHTKSFFEDLWHTISVKREMWRGTIINQVKNGEKRDCYSTIFPLFNENHDISNFVTIQEDVTEQNIKDKLFLMQTRQAQMGEMLSMIAHQWRQPLSVISTLLNKQCLNIALDNYTLEGIVKSMEDAQSQVRYLSETITDFSSFFKPDKVKTFTKNSLMFSKAIGLIEPMLKKEKIEIVQTHLNDENYQLHEHEMVQVLLNLIKNAQDAFVERNIENRKLIIFTDIVDNMSVMSVQDNAEGIDLNIINTLFLPYVSTKDEKNGTGVGMYMSKIIVEEHCKGTLRAENTQHGAKFTITIPINDIS